MKVLKHARPKGALLLSVAVISLCALLRGNSQQTSVDPRR